MPIFESTFDVKAIEVMKTVGSRYCMAFGLSFEMGFFTQFTFCVRCPLLFQLLKVMEDKKQNRKKNRRYIEKHIKEN